MQLMSQATDGQVSCSELFGFDFTPAQGLAASRRVCRAPNTNSARHKLGQVLN